MKILFVWPNKDQFGFKPIGLSLLAAIAGRSGWQVKLFDTTEIDFGFVTRLEEGENAKIFKPVDFSKYNMKKTKCDLRKKFVSAFEEFKPDCLAFSVLSDEYPIAAEITRIAKDAYPRIPVIWGGAYATLNPEKVLTAHNADFVCRGEGLEAFGDFLNALSRGGPLTCIDNIWSKTNGAVIERKLRPLKDNLDDLPYLEWSIFDKRQFYKAFDGKVYVGGDHMLNWGCPYYCSYCINQFYRTAYKNRYPLRRYGINRIIKELRHLKDKYGINFFKFVDEDFLLRPEDSLRELGELYAAEVKLPFIISTNPRSVTREKVALLKEMDCVTVSMGIETGDPQRRKGLLNRVDSEEDIVRAFSIFKEFGIKTSSLNMLGLPFESRETYNDTVELNRKAGAQYPNCQFFFPFEGTKLREISIEEGFFKPGKDEVYLRDRPVLTFKNLSAEELIEMRNVFVLYIKLPKAYVPFITRSEKQDVLGKKIRNRLLAIYENTVWKNDGWFVDDGNQDKYLAELNDLLQKEKALKA